MKFKRYINLRKNIIFDVSGFEDVQEMISKSHNVEKFQVVLEFNNKVVITDKLGNIFAMVGELIGDDDE